MERSHTCGRKQSWWRHQLLHELCMLKQCCTKTKNISHKTKEKKYFRWELQHQIKLIASMWVLKQEGTKENSALVRLQLLFCKNSIQYLLYTGTAISSCPKKSFWKPSDPGWITPATDGVSLPVVHPTSESHIQLLTNVLTLQPL